MAISAVKLSSLMQTFLITVQSRARVYKSLPLLMNTTISASTNFMSDPKYLVDISPDSGAHIRNETSV